MRVFRKLFYFSRIADPNVQLAPAGVSSKRGWHRRRTKFENLGAAAHLPAGTFSP